MTVYVLQAIEDFAKKSSTKTEEGCDNIFCSTNRIAEHVYKDLFR